MLEFEILGFLNEGPMHGYELKQRLSMLTNHFRPVSDGALYPAIGRLEKRGLLVKQSEIAENGKLRVILHLTDAGRGELLSMLRNPSEVDISDRNRYFTYLAFLKDLPPAEQVHVLQMRLDFLKRGKSFFSSGGAPVSSKEETDPIRQGMLLIAKETSRVERQWLVEMIERLSSQVEPS